MEEDVEGTVTSGAEKLDSRWMENIGEEVAAKVAPERAVRGGADPELVVGDHETIWSKGRGTVGEYSAVKD